MRSVRRSALDWAVVVFFVSLVCYGIFSLFASVPPLTPGGYQVRWGKMFTSFTVPFIGSEGWIVLGPITAFTTRYLWGVVCQDPKEARTGLLFGVIFGGFMGILVGMITNIDVPMYGILCGTAVATIIGILFESTSATVMGVTIGAVVSTIFGVSHALFFTEFYIELLFGAVGIGITAGIVTAVLISLLPLVFAIVECVVDCFSKNDSTKISSFTN